MSLNITSYSKSVETRIKELEEAQLSKERELSEIGEIIAKKEKILENFSEKTQNLLDSLIARKKAKLESQNNGKLSEEEIQKIADELRNTTHDFFHTVREASLGKGSIEGILTNGIFHEDTLENNKELNALKFFLVQCAFERNLMIKLVQQYESYIQKLGKINQELDKLRTLSTTEPENTLVSTTTAITTSSEVVTPPVEKKEEAETPKQASAFEEGMAGVLLGGLIVIWLARNF